MGKGQEWKKYENRRKRNVKINIRCTEEERQQVYKLAESKGKSLVDLVLYLVNQEVEKENK